MHRPDSRGSWIRIAIEVFSELGSDRGWLVEFLLTIGILYVAGGVLLIVLVPLLLRTLIPALPFATDITLLLAFIYFVPAISLVAWLLGASKVRARNRGAAMLLLPTSAVTLLMGLTTFLPEEGSPAISTLSLAAALLTFHGLLSVYSDRYRRTPLIAPLAWLVIACGVARLVHVLSS